MKATEFVKKFGWDWANEILMESHNCGLYVDANINVTCHQMMDAPEQYKDGDYVFHREDLERLVESYELVNHMGGLEKAMDAVINQEANGRNMTQLAQAIADVEACQ